MRKHLGQGQCVFLLFPRPELCFTVCYIGQMFSGLCPNKNIDTGADDPKDISKGLASFAYLKAIKDQILQNCYC